MKQWEGNNIDVANDTICTRSNKELLLTQPSHALGIQHAKKTGTNPPKLDKWPFLTVKIELFTRLSSRTSLFSCSIDPAKLDIWTCFT